MATSIPELEDQLRRLLPTLDLPGMKPPSEPFVTTLADFLRLLAKWNQAYNLTSVRDPHDMVVRHLLDSLVALPFLAGTRILDVGCGAGLPGIPLALAAPDREFTLLDSGIKKIRFVRQAVMELKIPNVRAEHVRLEDYAPMQPFDTIICRAFSSLAEFAAGCGRLLAGGGRLLAMKGRLPADELAALPAPWVVREVAPLRVPGLDAERHMVVLEIMPGRGA